MIVMHVLTDVLMYATINYCVEISRVPRLAPLTNADVVPDRKDGAGCL
jgi:hypothetical protein